MGHDNVVDIADYTDEEWCMVCDECKEFEYWAIIFMNNSTEEIKCIRCTNCGSEVSLDEEDYD